MGMMMRARALRMSRKSSRQAGRQAVWLTGVGGRQGEWQQAAIRATWHMKIERSNNQKKNNKSRENVATSWKNVCGLSRVFA